MKKQIRFGVFETNSSSTHSLTMCSKEDYEKWENGDVLLNEDSRWNKLNQWITKEEAIKYLKDNDYSFNEENLEEILRDCEIYTSDKYFDNEYLEGFEETYKTKSGEEIVAFGMFGYDG